MFLRQNTFQYINQIKTIPYKYLQIDILPSLIMVRSMLKSSLFDLQIGAPPPLPLEFSILLLLKPAKFEGQKLFGFSNYRLFNYV